MASRPASKIFHRSLLACAIAGVYFQPVLAQGSYTALEEVVVTATKRPESLQDIPVTVTALSETTIREAGITNLDGVANLVPSLTITSNINPFATAIRIRGIGSSQNDPSLEPSVAFVVDGVYLGRSGLGMSDLTDIERVEVLQGPQGTLYGKNANAGVISVVTKNPNGEETEGFIEATAGNYDAKRLVGSVSGPITDGLAYLLSGSWNQRDGTLENPVGPDQNAYKDWNVRGKLRWEPTDRFAAMLTASHADRDTTMGAADATQTNAVTSVLIAQGKEVPPNNARDYYNPINQSSDFDMTADTYILKMDYDLDWATLTSLTSYNDYEYTTSTDADRSELDVLSITNDLYTGNSFSQEFRLTSNLDGPLEYMAGLYYLDEENTRGDGSPFTYVGQDFVAVASQGAPPVGPIAPLIAAPGDYIAGDSAWNTKTWAVFGQSTYSFTENLSLTLGLRYTDEEKKAKLVTTTFSTAPAAAPGNPLPTLVDLAGAPIDENRKRNDDGFTYLASLRYFVVPDVMLFGTVATGTKAGGFNGVAGEGDGRDFDEENTINYELGIKSTLWDERLQLNATAFLTVFDDLQFLQQQATGVGTLVSNAAKAESKGVELSANALVLPNLILNAGVQYLDAQYTEGELQAFDVVFAPKWSGNLSGTFFLPLFEGNVYTRLDYTYMGDHYSNPSYQPESALQTKNLLNARLGWRNDNWDLAAWIKNATNNGNLSYLNKGDTGRAYSGLTGTPIAYSGTGAEWLSPPRTYGVTLRYSF